MNPPEYTTGRMCIDDTRIDVYESEFYGVYVAELYIKTRDVTGKIPDATHSTSITKLIKARSKKELDSAIRKHMIGLLTHELDEWLTSNGERITDPHP